MCVCVCARVCVCVCVFVCVCVCVCVLCVHVYVCMCVHACESVHVYVHLGVSGGRGWGMPVCWLFILVLNNFMHAHFDIHYHSTRTNHLWMEKLGVMGVMTVGCYPNHHL